MRCLYCNQETKNPKFCSMSHSAKYQYAHYPIHERAKQKPRNLEILDHVIGTRNFSQTAKHFHISRERVRQIIAYYGFTSKTIRKL